GIVALAGGGALQYAGLLPSPAATGADAAVLAALQSDVAALKDRPTPAADPADGAALGALSERVDVVVASIDQMKADLAASASADSGTSPAAAQALDERFQALETAIAALPAAGGDATALEAKLATLETGLAAAVRAVEDAKAAAEAADAASLARLATLEQTVAGLAGKVAEQAEQPNAALAIAASTLKAAIDRGDPFMIELETFAAVSPDSPEIAPLRDMAASGVPSRTAIAAGFPDAAAAMIAAARSADPDAGILDRLMSSAQSLVQVRPVGMVEGADVPAIVARMEVALNKGDYAAALKEHEALPPAAKAAGASYMATVQARLAADELTTKVLSAALKA
ncbi:MAG: mitofilin family membrane protein, partial [Mesorhizobium sp.]|nr:mitofilin family membrane protein [Mesorhizobium sp.]